MTSGRISSIGSGDISRLEKCFNLGMTVKDACFEVKITRSAFYRRLEVDEEFSARMEYARHFVMIKAKQNIAVAIVNDGNIDLSKWWIERKDPEFRIGARLEVKDEPESKLLDETRALKMLARMQEGIDARKNYHRMLGEP